MLERESAHHAVQMLGSRGDRLRQIADFVVLRQA